MAVVVRWVFMPFSGLNDVSDENQVQILLCEDDDAVRHVTERLLQRAGYEVLCAGDGEAALAILATRDVDLLITDVVMPGMSGPDLAKRFRSEHDGKRVLYVSGYTADRLDPAVELEPGGDFLAKPYSSDALLRRVARLLDK